MIYFIASDSFDFATPLFALDCELSETASASIELSSHPIESGQKASPYAARNPRQFTVAGRVTATPFDGEWDEQRVVDLHEALLAILDAREPVTLIARFWVVDVMLVNMSAEMNADIGLALDLEVTCETVYRPRPRYTEIPAELLAPEVRASATPAPVGGAAAAAEESGSDEAAKKTIAKQIVDGDFGDLGSFL